MTQSSPKATLYLFHYSGGGASSFRPLVKEIDPKINVIGIQLPGRENRFQEPFAKHLELLVQDLVKVFREALVPQAIFLGHSMGAGLAYECVMAMLLLGVRLPAHLIVSGRRAPHRPRSDSLRSDMVDSELVHALRRYGGAHETLLQDQEVLSFLLPLLRADLRILEQLRSKVSISLHLPITAIGGAQDPFVSEEDLEAWQPYTAKEFQCQMFEGGHFFLLQESPQSVAGLINRIGDSLSQ